ncbi:MAG: cellulase family glycosylhydrolase [Gaiellales bacterium]
MRRGLVVLGLAACIAMLHVPAALASGGPTPPAITTRGVGFVTAAGTPVVLRGVNMSYHSSWMTMVSRLGANFVRLRVLWSDVEPAPGLFDQAELAQLDTFVQYFNAHHVAVELDLRGDPVPAWFGSVVGFWKTHAEQSQAAYEPFVKTIVQRYDSYPYVVGFGIFNEPHPFRASYGTHNLDQTILRWQATIRNQVLALDPYTRVFFSVRGGNLGVKYANFKRAGFSLKHTVLDWHDFYNGQWGSGFDQQNDRWVPSWPLTHNQETTRYLGTQVNQWLNIAIPWKRIHHSMIPMIVGEWGVKAADPNRSVYDSQMAAIFAKTHLSWARWDLDNHELGLVSHGVLNDQGVWLQQLLTGSG